MTTDDPESQAEKRRVLRNDERVRNQSRNGDTSSYLDHAHSDLGGRFAVTEHQTITGVVSPSPPPLPANSPWHGSDPVPTEPPLGYRIDAMPDVATDDPATAPSSGSSPAPPASGDLVSKRAGSSPLSQKGEDQ